jgi:transposase
MRRKAKRKAKAARALPPGLESINLNAAAIDIGSTEHYVAVPPGRSAEAVRTFGSYTAALREMAFAGSKSAASPRSRWKARAVTG